MILTSAAPSKSNKLLYLALFFTVGMTIWTAMHNGDEQPSNEVIVTKKMNFSAKQDDVAETVSVEEKAPVKGLTAGAIKRESIKQPVLDLFKVHSWYVPPPVKKVKPVPPPAPVAPPLPFFYNGKLEGMAKGTLFFLVSNNVLYTVKIGDNVTPQWRLDSENPNMLGFTYIPLNLPQTLSKTTLQNSPVASADATATQSN